ncbi:MAG: hypothetical protein IKO63_08850 [Paludibacteraceae bacterium]|nr:hypothetical protein [Paludibacteraceae bacterium]
MKKLANISIFRYGRPTCRGVRRGRRSSMYGSCFEGLRQNKWNEAGQLVASYTDDEGAYYGYDGNG